MSVNSNWREISLKHLFTDRTAGAWGTEPEDLEDGVVCIRAADFITDEMRHVQNSLTKRIYEPRDIDMRQLLSGDLIIEKSGGGDNQPVGRVVSFNLDETALCSNFLERLRPNQEVLHSRFGAYLLYFLWSSRFIIPFIKQTTGIQNLDTQDYFQQTVEIPPLAHQEDIADYLDCKTKKIDTLLKSKERLLTLLAEKRRALITHAVTQGLNPDAPTRDSEVEWIGQIPAHWEIEYARWLFHEVDERSTAGEEELLTVSHITGVTSRAEKNVNMFMAESLEGYKVCQSGDLVINTLWAWMGAMGVALQNGVVSPAYNVYRSRGRYDPRYVDYLVRMTIFAQEVIRYSRGVWSSRLRLYPNEFFQIALPVLPMAEQTAIADYLDREIAKLEALELATKKTIDLLQERRTALIAAAVTGQISIPEPTWN
jgi:type I restriction enzyme, S subunit